jgi:hypothetical protein
VSGDIVERLRDAEDPAECWGCKEWGCRSTCDCDCHALGGIVSDAANEIERLRAEVERLRVLVAGAPRRTAEIERLRAAVDRLCLALLPLSTAGEQADIDELFAAIKEARRER